MFLVLMSASVCVIVLVVLFRGRPNTFVFEFIERIFGDRENRMSGG